MASNFGQTCRDIVGGNLQIKGRKVLDANANLKVNDAKIRGDVTIDGTVKSGSITSSSTSGLVGHYWTPSFGDTNVQGRTPLLRFVDSRSGQPLGPALPRVLGGGWRQQYRAVINQGRNDSEVISFFGDEVNPNDNSWVATHNVSTGTVTQTPIVDTSGMTPSLSFSVSRSLMWHAATNKYIFVAVSASGGTIFEIDPTTGDVINRTETLGGASYGPTSLIVGATLVGERVLVARQNTNDIMEYNATTGAYVGVDAFSGTWTNSGMKVPSLEDAGSINDFAYDSKSDTLYILWTFNTTRGITYTTNASTSIPAFPDNANFPVTLQENPIQNQYHSIAWIA